VTPDAAVDVARFAARVVAEAERFAAAEPYPHVVLDDVLDPGVADALAAEFAGSRDGWVFWHHVNERKHGLTDPARLGPVAHRVVAALQSEVVVGALAALCGVAGLRPDPWLDGGGLHEMLPGGHLNVHVDFRAHARERTWSRQVNLLLYLERDWDPAWGGALELWDRDVQRCVRRIEPRFNRCVIFRTTASSFHGVPGPLACPPGTSRKSLALYYFRDEGRALPVIPTRYVPRPGDGPLARVAIRGERVLLWGWTVLKRHARFADVWVSRLLRRL
jgi:hypothetical protein